MEDLYSFLEQTSSQSDFKANLSERGGFITFSNSGRRGSVKYFQIGLDNILQTLKDILNHIDVFGDCTEYDERTWRDNGAAYFEDPVANANSTVQTKPLFSTLSKVIKWANQPELNDIDPDYQIVLTTISLSNAITKLEAIAESFRPKQRNRAVPVVNKAAVEDSSYLPYLTALRTKPFMLLAGISGTGKSRIVRKLAQATNTKVYEKEEDRWNDNRPDNFELIQVKPNWHNSMDVVGYMSNIPTPHYVFTDFVRFVVKAWQHTDTPYFLCLDEMNLAPVEEYFAEFLSAIESRSVDENGNYTTDPIIKPFKNFGQEVCEAMLKELLGEARHTEANPLAVQFTEKGLTLPPNLMVMGTVNMDETTFSFSRKVLDRAMSVEMNEVNYDDFMEGKTELMPLLTAQNALLVNRPQKASEVQDRIDGGKVIAYLQAVNALLDGTPFKLGYRAANEAMLYVSACKDLAGEQFSIGKALDEFTLMKILSRIEGDDNRLSIDEKDARIGAAGITGAVTDNGEHSINLLNCLRAIVRQHIGQDTATEQKINSMYNTLVREHFVSYWG